MAERVSISDEEMNERMGARVVHIERVPTAGGGPGAYHWELTVRPWSDLEHRA